MTFEKSDLRKNGTLTIVGKIKEKEDETAIVCESAEILNLILEWTESGDWPFEAFAEFLRMIGLNTPVTLSDYNNWNQTFKCITSDKIEAEIYLTVGDCDELDSIISVTIGNEKRTYSMLDINMDPGKSTPSLYFDGRIISDKNRQLKSIYYGYGCYWEVENEIYRLQIRITEPYDSEEHIVTQKSPDIERLLMGISISENINVVMLYNSISSIIGFSKKQHKNSTDISIGQYILMESGIPIIQNKISVVNGHVEEITLTFEGETYNIKNNGSWEYRLNQDISFFIKYDSTTGNYELKSTGNEEELFLLTDMGTLVIVKNEVERLQKKYFSKDAILNS